MEQEAHFFTQPDLFPDRLEIIDGRRYRGVPSGYTVREYFSPGGPGWDTRAEALKKYGAADPAELPSTPYYFWQPEEETA